MKLLYCHYISNKIPLIQFSSGQCFIILETMIPFHLKTLFEAPFRKVNNKKFSGSNRAITFFESCSGIKKHLKVSFHFVNQSQKEKEVIVVLDLDQVLTFKFQSVFHYYIHLHTGPFELIFLISIDNYLELQQNKYTKKQQGKLFTNTVQISLNWCISI